MTSVIPRHATNVNKYQARQCPVISPQYCARPWQRTGSSTGKHTTTCARVWVGPILPESSSLISSSQFIPLNAKKEKKKNPPLHRDETRKRISPHAPMLPYTRFSENAYTCKRSRVLAKNYVIFKARTPRVTYLDVDGAVRVEGVVYPVQGDVDVRHRVQQFNQESRRYWRIHFGGHKADRQKIQTDRQALTDFFSSRTISSHTSGFAADAATARTRRRTRTLTPRAADSQITTWIPQFSAKDFPPNAGFSSVRTHTQLHGSPFLRVLNLPLFALIFTPGDTRLGT